MSANEITINKITIDEAPFNKYHLKLVAYCAGCPFVAGYVLGTVAISLSVMNTRIPMSPALSGLIGMGTLLGMMFGSLFGGYATDLLGRKKMYILDFLFLGIVSVLQYFITDPLVVFLLRMLLGVGLGATFTISGPYIAEFSPQKNRGAMLGILNALWFIGYAASNVVCYLLLNFGDDSWKWMVVSGAVPCFLWLISIRNMPESPRWLIGKGRGNEVAAILKKIGDNIVLSRETEPDPEGKASFHELFNSGYGKWLFFVAFFWTMQIIPVFALGTYLPTIMEQFGFADGNRQYLGSAIINSLYLIGLIFIFFFMDKSGRRPTLLISFFICFIALFILAFTADMNLPFILVLALFVLFGASNTAGGSHQFVYPNELFPTHIRATAVGVMTSITRIIAAIATFFTPIILSRFGLEATLYICAGLTLAGLVVSIIMAPETKDMSLTEASSLRTPRKAENTGSSVIRNR